MSSANYFSRNFVPNRRSKKIINLKSNYQNNKMRSVIFSKLCIAVFTVVLYFNFSGSIDIDNHQDIPDLIYFINGSYKLENLRRYTRQNKETCRIPSNPPHTIYNVIGETQTQLSAGNEAENFNILQITCSSGYSINPTVQNYSLCLNGKWTPPLTNCLRACPSLKTITSTNVKCKWIDHIGNEISLANCINPVEGTTVFLSCNSWYEEPNIKKNPIRLCHQGKWDPYISECYPICGVKRPKGMTNIINGKTAELGDYPWQIGIYNNQKEFLCGGSILDYRVILSAAHCFTDYEGNKQPTENYLIAAGKYYRQYDDERDKFSQYSKILTIHIPPRYKGITNLQGFDIAVLILESPLNISRSVQPVCVELDEESKSLHLSLNKYGTVTGWGYTESGRELSDVLKEIEIPYIPYEECFKTVPINFRRYITHDKICGGYINSGKAVCGGDSGGSYIFKQFDSDRHFVKGIVSVSPATTEGVCDPNQYSVYTFVDEHIKFIRRHLTYNQIHQGLECESDDCNEELPSDKDCSNSNDFACKNAKIQCTLPTSMQDGTYSLNQNQKYIPGGYAEIDSILYLKCNTGQNASFNSLPMEFKCSDKGEWNPPLKTCEDKPGYCRYGSMNVKEDTYMSTPLGTCNRVICLNAESNNFLVLNCTFHLTTNCVLPPYDYTKLYPDCCAPDVC